MKSIFAPWLVSIYRWYCQEAHLDGSDYDNFCRFGRIIFFWAPLLWLYQKIQVRILGPVELWMAALFGVWLAVLYFQWQMALTIAAVVLSFGVFFVLLSNLVGRGIVYRVLNYGRGILRVWTVLLATAVSVFIYVAWADFLKILAILAIWAGTVGVVLGIIYLLVKVSSRRTKRPSTKPQAPQLLKNVGGVISVGWHWLLIMKRKTICPWVRMTAGGYVQFYWSEEVPVQEN